MLPSVSVFTTNTNLPVCRTSDGLKPGEFLPQVEKKFCRLILGWCFQIIVSKLQALSSLACMTNSRELRLMTIKVFLHDLVICSLWTQVFCLAHIVSLIYWLRFIWLQPRFMKTGGGGSSSRVKNKRKCSTKQEGSIGRGSIRASQSSRPGFDSRHWKINSYSWDLLNALLRDKWTEFNYLSSILAGH